MLLMVDFYSLTSIGVAFADAVAAILAGVGRVLALTDVGRLSFSYSGPCSSRRLGIVPSSSSVFLESLSLYLVVWILQQLLLFL